MTYPAPDVSERVTPSEQTAPDTTDSIQSRFACRPNPLSAYQTNHHSASCLTCRQPTLIRPWISCVDRRPGPPGGNHLHTSVPCAYVQEKTDRTDACTRLPPRLPGLNRDSPSPTPTTRNKPALPACLPARRLPVNPALSQAPAENPKIMSLPGVRCLKPDLAPRNMPMGQQNGTFRIRKGLPSIPPPISHFPVSQKAPLPRQVHPAF